LKKLIYIGNNLTKKTAYNSTMTLLTDLLVNEGFYVMVSSNKTNKILRLFDMCFSIFKNRKSVDYILIDTFSTYNFYYALITSQIARLFSLNYVPILHGGNLPSRLDKSNYLSKLVFKHSYKNVTPSKYLEVEFNKRNYKTIYIPNSIVLSEYKFKERKLLKPTILWVRAFDKTYNPILGVKVLNLLKKEFKNVKLCMVGPVKDGTFEQVQLLVNKLDLSENIIFTGVLPKEKWHQLSEEYDIFMNTTNIDNMPVSVLEAMALGLPVVSTNVGGIPYLITDEKNGILVPVNDEIAMSNAIINLIENQGKANKISLEARLYAEQFDVEKIKEQWFKLLK